MTNDNVDLPEWVDARLAVTIRDVAGTSYLVGKSHSSLGSISCYGDGNTFTATSAEIEWATDLAQVWLDGFFAGSEPPPPMHGDPVNEAQWELACAQYGATGEMPDLDESRYLAGKNSVLARIPSIDGSVAFASFVGELALAIRGGGNFAGGSLEEQFLDAWSASIEPGGAGDYYGYARLDTATGDWRVLARTVARAVWSDADEIQG